MASPNFTVNGSATPPEVAVAYGSTVNLALVSTSGVGAVAVSIVGTSSDAVAIPALTLSGSVPGALASFVVSNDPGNGLGVSYIVKYVINGGRDSAGQPDPSLTKTALVGVANALGVVPSAVGEKFERSTSHGWTKLLNSALAAANAISTATMAVPVVAVAAPPGWNILGAFPVATTLGATLDVIGSVSDAALTMSVRLYCITPGSVGTVSGSLITLNSTTDARVLSSLFSLPGPALYQLHAQVVGVAGDSYFGLVRRAATV